MVTEIQKMLTLIKVDKSCFYSRYIAKNSYMAIYCSGDAGAITMSSSSSEFYPLDRNFGIPGPFGHGNQLTSCKYLAMQLQLCRGGLGAL